MRNWCLSQQRNSPQSFVFIYMGTSHNDDQVSMEPISKETGLVRRSEFLTERVRQLARQVRELGLTEGSVRQNACAHYRRGMSRYDSSQYGQAIQDFSEAARLDPKWASAHSFVGLSHYHLNQYEQALQDFGNAVRLDLKFASAYLTKAMSHHLLGQYGQAIKDFSTVIKLNPKWASAYYGRGRAHQRLGNYKEAGSDLEAAEKLGFPLAGSHYLPYISQ